MRRETIRPTRHGHRYAELAQAGQASLDIANQQVCKAPLQENVPGPFEALDQLGVARSHCPTIFAFLNPALQPEGRKICKAELGEAEVIL